MRTRRALSNKSGPTTRTYTSLAPPPLPPITTPPPLPPLSPLTTYVRVRRCTTEKANTAVGTAGYFIKSVGLVGVCQALGYMWRPTSATGGEYGSYSATNCASGTYTPTETFSYSTTTTKNCVTNSGKFYTYKTVFADATATKVGVDFEVEDSQTCASPEWQGAPLVNVCTEIKTSGISMGGFKFLPVAAGDLATGGMSAEKSVVYLQFLAADCTGVAHTLEWGGVYSTGCADTSKTFNSWKVRHSLHATRAFSTFSCSPLLIRLLFSHHSSAMTKLARSTPAARSPLPSAPPPSPSPLRAPCSSRRKAPRETSTTAVCRRYERKVWVHENVRNQRSAPERAQTPRLSPDER